MKKLRDNQKKYFYMGLTLFISLSLVLIVSNFFTRAALIVNLIGRIFSALTPLWIGLIIAYLINPLVKFFENKVFSKLLKGKHKGAQRGLSVTVSILLLLALLIGLLVLVIPQLVDTIITLVQNSPKYYRTLQEWIDAFAKDHPTFGAPIKEAVDGGYDKLIHWFQTDLVQGANTLGTVTSGLMSAANVLINFFVGLIISIYLLCDRENFLSQTKKLTAAVFSEKWYTRIMTMASETHHVFGEFIMGKILDSLFVGIVTFIFMWATSIPYATLVATLVAVCNLIPFFGQFIGIIPSTLLILVIDPIKAIIFVVGIVIFMQIDANIISPKILGNSIGLKSFWILFSIIFFGGMFGMVGMIVGVPVFAIIYRIVTRFMDRHLRHKGLPTEAYEYAAAGMTYPDRKSRRKLGDRIKSAEAETAGEAQSDDATNNDGSEAVARSDGETKN